MLFKIQITTVEVVTVERDTRAEAAEYADQLAERLVREAHHGEQISVMLKGETFAREQSR